MNERFKTARSGGQGHGDGVNPATLLFTMACSYACWDCQILGGLDYGEVAVDVQGDDCSTADGFQILF